jgi:hypothetical protein
MVGETEALGKSRSVSLVRIYGSNAFSYSLEAMLQVRYIHMSMDRNISFVASTTQERFNAHMEICKLESNSAREHKRVAWYEHLT